MKTTAYCEALFNKELSIFIFRDARKFKRNFNPFKKIVNFNTGDILLLID